MRHIISLFILLSLSLLASAQKITLGSCILKDGGQYQGEMVAGKAHGKGKATYNNGDMYEGEYAKGRRHGYGVYTFADG